MSADSEQSSTGVESDRSTGVSSRNPFVEAWYGRERLAVVWWGFAIPLKLISWALNAEWTIRVVYGGSAFILLAVFAVTMSAYVAITIMAWRCAPNTDEQGIKWIARALLVGGWVWFIYRLSMGSGA